MVNTHTSSAVLTVKDVGKSYGIYAKPHQRLLSYLLPRFSAKAEQFTALQAISFTLAKGETLGIIGRNGAGKSTLLQILCGTLAPSQGEVSHQGRIAALLELGAGFNPEFTGRENILLNAAIYGLSQAQIAAKLEAIIAFAGIGEFIDQPVQHYSSGMFVRLAFAVIAHVDADILIIDEALAVGDALFAQKCMRFLEAFKQRGSILFVSHDSGAVTRLCDRALWLDKGKMRLIGSASDVSEAYLEHIYAKQQQVTVRDGASQEQASQAGDHYQPIHAWHDGRADLLHQSNLRNDWQLAPFCLNGRDFGTGDVEIADICLRDQQGRPLAWVVGGTQAVLEIVIKAKIDIDQLIVGFLVKDKQGQTLFGENNYLFHHNAPITIQAHRYYAARFGLTLPYLPAGDYVVSVAVASGTQQQHIQHCWRHDGLMFSALASHVVHGLVGVPVSFCDVVAMEQCAGSEH